MKSGLPVGHVYGREIYIGVDVVDVVTVWYGEKGARRWIDISREGGTNTEYRQAC